MATVERFQDLDAWKSARNVVNVIYRHSNRSPFAKDFPLRDQLRRAAISIMANIAEGFERGGDKEFVHFLSIAKGSCGEVRSLLAIASDQSYFNEADYLELDRDCQKVSRLIMGLMRYLDRSQRTGRRLGATDAVNPTAKP